MRLEVQRRARVPVPGVRRKGSAPLAQWERRFLEEAARMEEDCKSSSEELDRGYGPAPVRYAAFVTKVLAYEAEAGARLTAVVSGEDGPDEDDTAGSWLYFE